MNQRLPATVPGLAFALALALAAGCANVPADPDEPDVTSANEPLDDWGDEGEPAEARKRHRHRHGPRDHHPHHNQRPHSIARLVRVMEHDLALTEAQDAQVDEIVSEARAKRRALRHDNASDRASRREAMHALSLETRDALLDVLDDEQRATLEARREAHQEARVDQRLARMTKNLALTDAQRGDLRRILVDAHRELDALRTADAETVPAAERRPRADAVRAATRERLGEVLDEDQRAKLDAFLERRRGRRGR